MASDDSQTIITGSLTAGSNGRIEGWNPQPNSRGTLDILWTCVVTTVLCTYTILCINCPTRKDGFWTCQARKVLWMGVAISGPEFILTAASGQLAAARRDVQSFHSAGHTQWTYRHAFFANMGGFELIPPDGGPFRVNSKHIHWLVSRDYIDFPDVTSKELWDKSKQDTIARTITCFQVGYLILQCIGRAVQGLAVTTFELATVAIRVCSVMSSLCWMAKPQDVHCPLTIDLKVPMAQVLREAGPIASRPYRQTPLDFVDDLRPSWALNVHTFMRMSFWPYERPIPRIGDSRLPRFTWIESSYLCLGTVVYAAIHLAGWHISFPTRVEQILWRLSSLIIVGTTASFWVLESLAKTYRHQCYSGRQTLRQRLQNISRRGTSNTMPEQSPDGSNSNSTIGGDNKAVIELTVVEAQAEPVQEGPFEPRKVPLVWEFWSIFPIAVIYAMARGYILFESLLGLRSLPLSTYLTVEWAQFIPHI